MLKRGMGSWTICENERGLIEAKGHGSELLVGDAGSGERAAELSIMACSMR